MTEIPEHLLKRSRERRAAMGGGEASDGGDEAASSAPVPAKASEAAPAAAAPSGPPQRAAAPSPAAPEPPKPDIPVVAAYKRRRKIPFWAMTALALLPVWAFMYARAVTQQAEEAAGPLAEGELIYGNCASCHGGAGQGGLGYAFTDGEVFETFPAIEDQLRYVYWGTAEYQLAGVEIYGNPEREGGPHITGERGPMPAQGADAGGALTDYEILGVVCHERYALGSGGEVEAEFEAEFELWCSEESEIYEAIEGGGMSLLTISEEFEDVMEIGAPRPGVAAAGEASGE